MTLVNQHVVRHGFLHGLTVAVGIFVMECFFLYYGHFISPPFDQVLSWPSVLVVGAYAISSLKKKRAFLAPYENERYLFSFLLGLLIVPPAFCSDISGKITSLEPITYLMPATYLLFVNFSYCVQLNLIKKGFIRFGFFKKAPLKTSKTSKTSKLFSTILNFNFLYSLSLLILAFSTILAVAIISLGIQAKLMINFYLVLFVFLIICLLIFLAFVEFSLFALIVLCLVRLVGYLIRLVRRLFNKTIQFFNS
jgi:hypothetical protein